MIQKTLFALFLFSILLPGYSIYIFAQLNVASGIEHSITKDITDLEIFSSPKVMIENLNNSTIDTLDSRSKEENPSINKIIKDEDSGLPMLIGLCTREAFKDTNFYWWWMSEYDLYNIDSTKLNGIKTGLKDINIKLVMGTWCSDSRREVPRFFKILDSVDYPSDKVEIICVDEGKKTEGDELGDLKIDLVPTFIFYKDGHELGRIVEAPEDTLEKDMIKILGTHS